MRRSPLTRALREQECDGAVRENFGHWKKQAAFGLLRSNGFAGEDISESSVSSVFFGSAMVVLPHTSPIGLAVGVAQLQEEAADYSDQGLILGGTCEKATTWRAAVSFRGESSVGALREQIAMIAAESQCFTGDDKA